MLVPGLDKLLNAGLDGPRERALRAAAQIDLLVENREMSSKRGSAIGYALLGATWLVMKTEGELRDRAYGLSWALLFAMLGAIGAVSIATPFLSVQYTQRWFAWPNIIFTAPVPIAVV